MSTTELFREAGRLWGTSQQCKALQSCLLQSEQPPGQRSHRCFSQRLPFLNGREKASILWEEP